MAEKNYASSKLINLHSADGTTLLIPKIPLSTVDNNAYTVVDGAIVTKGAGVSLQSAVQAEIAAAIADSVVGDYVSWSDGSNVVIPGTLTVEGDTTLAGVTATNADITGTLDVTGKATLSDALDVTGAATLKGAVRVEGKLVAAQDMYIETTADGSTTSTKVATMADIDGITGGTLNNYYTKGEVDAIAEGTLEDANVYTDSASTALSAQVTTLDTKVTTDYATKVYVGEQIAAIDHLKREIVTELPTGEAIDTNTIYMVKMGDQGENVYREYMYIEGKWEIVGDSNIDFSNYYTKGEVDTKIGSYYTKGEIDAALADYALTTYVDAQDGSTLTSANAYADAAVSTASSALNDSITAVDGKFASYYDKDTVDATFAPIDGATLTNVVSITGDAAHVTVSKVTATELQIVNEVQLAGVIVGSDVGSPIARITEDGTTFTNAEFTSLTAGNAEVTGMLTVGDSDGNGSANILGTLTAKQIHATSAAYLANLSAPSFNAGNGAFTVGVDDQNNATVDIGDLFEADLHNSTVKVYDEWQVPSEDGSSTVTSTGLANVATEHDISSIVQALDKTILYDVLEDEQI